MDTMPPFDGLLARDLDAQQALLRRLALALARDEASADDLVQEAQVRALRWHGPAPVGWLVSVVRRLAATERRATARRARREAEVARPEAEPPDQDALARRLDLQAWLGQRLCTLPPEQSHALALRYGDGMSPAAISAHLGVPEATVKTRLRRGLAGLRKGLDAEHARDDWRLTLLVHAAPGSPEERVATPALAAAAAGVSGGVAALWAAVAVAVAAGVGLIAFTSARDPRRAAPRALTSLSPIPLGHTDDSGSQQPAVALAAVSSDTSASAARSDRRTAGVALADGDASGRRASTAASSDVTVATVRVHLDHPGLDADALRALAGRVAFEVPDGSVRELELRGELRSATIERQVPASQELRIVARLDGYDTPPVELVAPSPGDTVDVRLAPTPAPGSVAVTLLLGFARDVAPRTDLEGQLWLVTAREGTRLAGTTLEMPMRKVAARNGRLGFGRVPRRALALEVAPYGARSSGATEMLLGEVEASLEADDEVLVPVTLHRSGTFTLVARDADGSPLQARATVQGPDGSSSAASFMFRGNTAYHGSTTHDSLRAFAVPPLLPGRYTLQVTCEGHVPAQRVLLLRSGEVTDVDVTLQRETPSR